MHIRNANQQIENGAVHWNSYLKGVVDEEFNSDQENPSVYIEETDFNDVELEEYDFSYVTFVKCTFTNCSFSSCKLDYTEFEKSKMASVAFSDGGGEGFKIVSSEVLECNFYAVRIGDGLFSSSNFDGVTFHDCHWDGDEFSNCVFMRCVFIRSSFDECELSECKIHFSNVWSATFRNCSFNGLSMCGYDFLSIVGGSSLKFPESNDAADFFEDNERLHVGSDFLSCRFLGSELAGVDFGNSNLGESSFYRSDLRGANLSKCTNLSAKFDYCDLESALLPASISFDLAISSAKELSTSLQRICYFSLGFCLAAIVGSLSEIGSNGGIKFPIMGWELAAGEFGVIVSLVIVALQLIVMVRSDNIACQLARLPAMLPNAAPSPSVLRDTFVADVAWKFAYTPTMHAGFARRSYGWLSLCIAFLVLHFQFPIAIFCLVVFVLLHSASTALCFCMLIICIVAVGLAVFGSFALVASFRRLTVTGRRKGEFN